MRKFCFLSEAFWENVVFLILFFFLSQQFISLFFGGEEYATNKNQGYTQTDRTFFLFGEVRGVDRVLLTIVGHYHEHNYRLVLEIPW